MFVSFPTHSVLSSVVVTVVVVVGDVVTDVVVVGEVVADVVVVSVVVCVVLVGVVEVGDVVPAERKECARQRVSNGVQITPLCVRAWRSTI